VPARPATRPHLVRADPGLLHLPLDAQFLKFAHDGAGDIGPELAVIIWSAGLIAVLAPTAVALYRRKVLR
jgi:hypothetical protein